MVDGGRVVRDGQDRDEEASSSSWVGRRGNRMVSRVVRNPHGSSRLARDGFVAAASPMKQLSFSPEPTPRKRPMLGMTMMNMARNERFKCPPKATVRTSSEPSARHATHSHPSNKPVAAPGQIRRRYASTTEHRHLRSAKPWQNQRGERQERRGERKHARSAWGSCSSVTN